MKPATVLRREARMGWQSPELLMHGGHVFNVSIVRGGLLADLVHDEGAFVAPA